MSLQFTDISLHESLGMGMGIVLSQYFLVNTCFDDVGDFFFADPHVQTIKLVLYLW